MKIDSERCKKSRSWWYPSKITRKYLSKWSTLASKSLTVFWRFS